MKSNNKSNKPKSRWHKWLFGALYLLIVIALFGLFYNFIVRDETGSIDTDEAETSRVTKYDTLDVIGDYLWPGMKLDTGTDEDKDEKKDEKKETAVQTAPAIEAEAATEQDIEDATGLSSGSTTTPAAPADAPKTEQPNAPKIEAIE